MIQLTSQSRILLAIQPADFRKGIDGLRALCRQQLEKDPMEGGLFVFINRSQTTIRILCYDNNGFWLMSKRLSQGRYRWWPRDQGSVSTIQAKQLTSLLKGLVP